MSKKITVYECETCGMGFATAKECDKCEASHQPIVGVFKCEQIYHPLDKVPAHLIFTVRGKRIWFSREDGEE